MNALAIGLFFALQTTERHGVWGIPRRGASLRDAEVVVPYSNRLCFDRALRERVLLSKKRRTIVCKTYTKDTYLYP